MTVGAVALSFELDADLFWLAVDPTATDRPKTLSIGRYGLTRGVDRVLATLSEHAISATWFVPGLIAQREPETLLKLVDANQEIASRAWQAGGLGGRPLTEQRAEIERGIREIERITGVSPRGFRAPAGEVDETTFVALAELGVQWSSSLRGGEQPGPVDAEGADGLVDIGTRWELTDYVHFQFNYHPAYPAGQSRIASYSGVLREWVDDALSTTALGLPCVFTLTPEVIGKPGRSLILRRLLAKLREQGRSFATLSELHALTA